MKNSTVLVLALVLGISSSILPLTTITAQTGSATGPQFTLSRSTTSSLMSGEKQCEYFLWTTLGGTAQRISFTYIDQGGKVANDAPRLENVVITLDPAKSVPTATLVGTDENRRTLWRITMSQETYQANQQCLPAVTSAPGKR